MSEPRELSAASPADRGPNPELVLTHLDGLPTLSAIAIRVLQVTADSTSSTEDIVAVLRGDQSLTAKILSVAGSAWSGARGPICTLEKAVPLLGFRAIRGLVLAVSVFDCFLAKARRDSGEAFDPGEFWKHALAVACAARGLAAACRELGVDPQDAFVAGLLHDLGKVALSAVFPKAYERIAAQANQARGDIADFERRILGTDHTVAGRRLAERWRLPRELQEVIWLHHLAAETLPPSVAKPALVALVQLADTLAREQRIGYSGNHMFYENSPRLAERLGVSAAQLDGLVQALVGEVVAQAELLGLGHEPPDALYLQALTRANAELGRLNTELMVNVRRLAAGARYFHAISEFDRQLGAWSDPPAVVAAMARSAAMALQRPRVAAFGLRDNQVGVDLCWVAEEPARGGSLSASVSADLRAWLQEPGDAREAIMMRAPLPIRQLLAPALEELGGQAAWFVPIVHGGRVAGGIVFCSDADERARLASEIDDLRCFIASLGLALGRANAQAAARRLSDDLAETNRRLQRAQVELLRSRTLSMIAEMAAGAGHELNGPLTVISGRAQMLLQQLEDPEVQRSLELIHGKAHECSRIVSELMNFARPRPPQRSVIDLGQLLAEIRGEWLGRSTLTETRLRLEVYGAAAGTAPVAEQPAVVSADRAQLKTAFHELLSNATDAVAGGEGIIEIVCQPAVTEGFVEVVVRDGGCGMPPAVLQRAFDPFFSHRQAGRGRGLGLPRAYRIVEGHGGRIWLESVPGQGTTAHVLLPTISASCGLVAGC